MGRWVEDLLNVEDGFSLSDEGSGVVLSAHAQGEGGKQIIVSAIVVGDQKDMPLCACKFRRTTSDAFQRLFGIALST